MLKRLCVALSFSVAFWFMHHTASFGGDALPASEICDTVSFGDEASEKVHGVTGALSETLTGLLGQPARRLLPKDPQAWDGGSVSFSMKVDGDKPNYFTARF